MNSSCSDGMPHASAAARASVSRISDLTLSKSSLSGWPGFLERRKVCIVCLSFSVCSSSMWNSRLNSTTKSAKRRASWSKTAMLPLVM